MTKQVSSTVLPTRDEIIPRMAKAFHELLTALAGPMKGNQDLSNGIREGLRKFLSNVHISIVGDKRKNTDFFSEEAYDALENQQLKAEHGEFVYEHIVPKNIYQDRIIDAFLEGNGMTVEDIKKLLDKFWWIATITKEEDKKLSELKMSRKMPDGWDENDIHARYNKAGIVLRTRNEWNDIKSGGK